MKSHLYLLYDIRMTCYISYIVSVGLASQYAKLIGIRYFCQFYTSIATQLLYFYFLLCGKKKKKCNSEDHFMSYAYKTFSFLYQQEKDKRLKPIWIRSLRVLGNLGKLFKLKGFLSNCVCQRNILREGESQLDRRSSRLYRGIRFFCVIKLITPALR